MDPIAQLVTSLKNASMARKKTLRVPASKFKKSILEKLAERGYISSYDQEKEKGQLFFTIELGAIDDMRRISKPSRRVYIKAQKIPLYSAKRSKLLLSTPHGLLFDDQARKKRAGGEIILEVS